MEVDYHFLDNDDFSGIEMISSFDYWVSCISYLNLLDVILAVRERIV